MAEKWKWSRSVVSSCGSQRLLIFLPAILIPACVSSSPAFLMMYSAYKLKGWQYTALTYSFSYLEPVCFSMSSSNCCFLTCIQISQEAGQLVFPPLSEFSTVYCDPHSQKLCNVNKAEIDVFLELSCFLDDPADVGNLISGSSAFSKTSLNIWKVTVHILLKSGLENFEHFFTSVWDECYCVVVEEAYLWWIELINM